MSLNSSRRTFLNAAALFPASSALNAASMARRAILGRTGLSVSRFVCGSMIATDTAVLEHAYDLGVNCFASARDYQNGNNERVLGAALTGKREKVVLITECLDMMWRPKEEKETTKFALDTLNTSLRELRTDYVDIWFLHHKDSPETITDEALEALRIAKQQGKIRHAGVTTHALPKMADYIVANPIFEAVIPIYNFTMDDDAHAAIKKVHDAGLGVIAMKTMAGGLRSDKPDARMNRPGALQAAFKWVLKNPNVDAAVTSVKDFDQVEDNVRAMTAAFTSDDRKLLAAALGEFGPKYCRLCGRCEGACSKGLHVAEIQRCGMYAEGYGQFALGRKKFLELPEQVRSASCSDCSECSVQCAYGVRVAERVSRAQALLA